MALKNQINKSCYTNFDLIKQMELKGSLITTIDELNQYSLGHVSDQSIIETLKKLANKINKY